MPNVAKAKRVHIALAVPDLRAAIEEYTKRLGVEPTTITGGQYALLLAPILNLSVTLVPGAPAKVRHLGFEDDSAHESMSETDPNGLTWEHFTLEQQAREIIKHYGSA
jgi:catechol 2,3-dioxygenase-like lactoylglutathione lyase family enzyme